ncbi:MAG: hypothetical protein HZA63_14475 [Rhodocyclales bacterium]|nr:hypothetical protein [Rhodocyclales bacterium]
MPEHQTNAPFQPSNGLMMRVGVPHRGGRLAFHAFNNEYPVMVSASAFWDRASGRFKVPRASDLEECDFALDSAGFTAIRGWQRHGAQAGMLGVYPWSLQQYLELASELRSAWFAQPDLACEPELAGSDEERQRRIEATAMLLEASLQQLYAWQNILARSCNARTVANMLFPPVPVLQGWTPDDYLRSLDLMQAVWRRWQPWLAPPALIGIGSVCRRHLHDRRHGLLAVLGALEGHLPPASRLHLFGVKGDALPHLRLRRWIASADSMAYDDGARRAAYRERRSNPIDSRQLAMSAWMSKARSRMRPRPGDQERLDFQGQM